MIFEMHSATNSFLIFGGKNRRSRGKANQAEGEHFMS